MLGSDSQYDFVELSRTFHELSQYDRESDDADINRVFNVGDRLSWSALIPEYRVVLLSEAGSGKTEEIRNIAQKLRREGKAAFFIRLEHVQNDLEDAFEIGSFDHFQEWLVSGEEGWLLLDSVEKRASRASLMAIPNCATEYARSR